MNVSTLGTHRFIKHDSAYLFLCINASYGCVHVITYTVPTCGQKAMGSKQQLWRDLHFGFALVFKSRKVSLVLIGCHLFPGAIVR